MSLTGAHNSSTRVSNASNITRTVWIIEAYLEACGYKNVAAWYQISESCLIQDPTCGSNADLSRDIL